MWIWRPLSALFGLEFYIHSSLSSASGVIFCNASYYFQDYRLTPQTITGLFSMLSPYLHAFRKTSQKVTYPNTTPSQSRLTIDFLFVRLPKRRCILLVIVVSINPYLYSFNHAISSLYILRIPLTPMWIWWPLSALFSLKCYIHSTSSSALGVTPRTHICCRASTS